MRRVFDDLMPSLIDLIVDDSACYPEARRTFRFEPLIFQAKFPSGFHLLLENFGKIPCLYVLSRHRYQIRMIINR
uniref:Uncharacterized protein n=1 Tax=Nelumbo nucifera TaxID=4432 RepID=A0A822XXJ9_NELNU|nr:TPA_asm: hypothetical protein HUJ06_023581 [Nelumbo nucifera]